MTRHLIQILLVVLFPFALCNAQSPKQQEMERKFQEMFCSCFSDDANKNDFDLEHGQRECDGRFFEENSSAFGEALKEDTIRFANLSKFEKDHLLGGVIITNSVSHIMKNCPSYYQAVTKAKTVYLQRLKQQQTAGEIPKISEILKTAPVDKFDPHEAAEFYEIIAMLYEIEGNNSEADRCYQKSLASYPRPLTMAFYQLFSEKNK